MIQYGQPVRMNTGQTLRYTFKDQAGAVIDLTPFATATMLLKRQGAVVSSSAADITSPATLGEVTGSCTFGAAGVWDLQFYASTSGGSKVYGEPLQVKVVPNTDDLALGELAQY